MIQIGAALNIPGITSAISTVQTTTAGVQTFEGATSVTINAVQGAITTALSAVNDNININNTVVAASGSVSGMTSGGSPGSLASGLTSQANSFSELRQLYQVQSSLQRMFTNVGSGGP